MFFLNQKMCDTYVGGWGGGGVGKLGLSGCQQILWKPESNSSDPLKLSVIALA